MTTNTESDEYDLNWDDEPDCMTCGGDGWGYRGEDWDNDDPVNDADGVLERCPNCRGSGLATDQQYW